MPKYLLTFFNLIIIVTCFSQKTIEEFKTIADHAIKKSFSKAIFKKVKCEGYVGQEANKANMIGGSYEPDKNKKVSIELIAMAYLLYSKELNYEFAFNVNIDSSLNTYAENGGIKDIPPCVRKKGPCNYIKKKEAIEIARKDSILYPDNLLVEMLKPKRSEEFYWVISGQDKRNVDYSFKPDDGWNIFPKKKENTRYVNAMTGQMISYAKYQVLDE